MEIQFEQNRDFNQLHREENPVSDKKEEEKGELGGSEGNPDQKLVNREELNKEERELDRRPADIAHGEGDQLGDESSSAIAGVQSDQQNSTRGNRKPLGEDPNYNAETENKENKAQE
ncbi:hypothetical protein [Pedobacter montanisoli]|uniref:Uncharacterized protein n=1 Tax=Pedobacter montanisoli TaxID=2923277 RepID=A0ABS9ZZH5_9SPHI|nr:hypothetical protein [Pedobacter montanisoli]MCJ0743713.1 hypothetical protein [Pedobacter montanisoli]